MDARFYKERRRPSLNSKKQREGEVVRRQKLFEFVCKAPSLDARTTFPASYRHRLAPDDDIAAETSHAVSMVLFRGSSSLVWSGSIGEFVHSVTDRENGAVSLTNSGAP